MKKFWILMAALCVLFCTGAMAEDLGVQIVAGETTSEPTYLDDVQLEGRYDIPGYARVLPVKFEFVDKFTQFDKGFAGDVSDVKNAQDGNRLVYVDYYRDSDGVNYYQNIRWMRSRSNTQFALFQVDLVNLHKDAYTFMGEVKVVYVFDNQYEYVGWVRQYDTDAHCNNYVYTSSSKSTKTTYYPYIQPADELPIDMVGTGHYIFGCTLPNAVVEGEEPLRVEITLGEHFIVYYIRK